MHTLAARMQQSQAVDTARPGWIELATEDISEWNARLLSTDACYWQYPYFVDSYRSVRVQPRYLVWNNATGHHGYVCILSIGFPPLRAGVVLRGPVSTISDELLATEALRDLYEWAKTNGYALIRFTHSDSDLLDRIASVGPSERCDTFPLFRDDGAAGGELIVDQVPDDARMLARFDREARRKIRRAVEAGYSLESADNAEFLECVWPLFTKCSERKGFILYRSLAEYLDMVERARTTNCVRIYAACASGKPVEALLVFRDRCTAFCFLAALDIDALNGKPTPSVLLHWHAMRDLFKVGCIYYSFGPGEGGVARFKEQFSPRHLQYPLPVTLIINPSLYAAWKRMLPLVRRTWPVLKRVVSRVHS